MKRLFCVKRNNKNLVIQGEYFLSKKAAKAFRDDLGGIEAGFHVARGVDHWRGVS